MVRSTIMGAQRLWTLCYVGLGPSIQSGRTVSQSHKLQSEWAILH